MRRLLLAFLLVVTAFPSAAQPASPPDPRQEKLASITRGGVDDYILGAYTELRSGVEGLDKALEAHCTSPSASTQGTLKSAFPALLSAWAGVDFLQFGPMVRQNRFDRFAFWPDPHGTGERQLRQWLAGQDPAMVEPGAIARQSAAVQGLPALERLLFEPGRGLAVISAPDSYRCQVARAVADNLKTIAIQARSEWDGDKGWRALMLAPGPDNPVYVKLEEPVVELLKALLSGIERLADQRIQPARGPGAQFAKASRAPYALSGATPAYWRATAGALERFAKALRLQTVIPDSESYLGSSADFEFGNLKSALGAIGDELEPALTRPDLRARLGYAIVVLQSLRALIGTQIPSAAGLTAGFNALDGD